MRDEFTNRLDMFRMDKLVLRFRKTEPGQQFVTAYQSVRNIEDRRPRPRPVVARASSRILTEVALRVPTAWLLN